MNIPANRFDLSSLERLFSRPLLMTGDHACAGTVKFDDSVIVSPADRAIEAIARDLLSLYSQNFGKPSAVHFARCLIYAIHLMHTPATAEVCTYAAENVLEFLLPAKLGFDRKTMAVVDKMSSDALTLNLVKAVQVCGNAFSHRQFIVQREVDLPLHFLLESHRGTDYQADLLFACLPAGLPFLHRCGAYLKPRGMMGLHVTPAHQKNVRKQLEALSGFRIQNEFSVTVADLFGRDAVDCGAYFTVVKEA